MSCDRKSFAQSRSTEFRKGGVFLFVGLDDDLHGIDELVASSNSKEGRSRNGNQALASRRVSRGPRVEYTCRLLESDVDVDVVFTEAGKVNKTVFES